MKPIARPIAVALFLALSIAWSQAQEATVNHTHFKVGDTAPDFALLSTNWETVKLGSYRGRKNVVLVFYVLAFSPN